MSGDDPRDLAAADQQRWARVLFEGLVEAGLEEVVISPGSRSTPFVLAALRLVSEKRLRCHDMADERAAGFFALGRARASGRPCLLLCTSGSAPAHYYPAVLEAEAEHLPLLILSADRPPELQHCGANQTLDQLHLYGRHVRRFFELGTPDGSETGLRSLRRQAAQALFYSRWPQPGPVHLNARARKPLEPAAQPADQVAAPLPGCTPVPTAPRELPCATALQRFLDRARSAQSGLIVAGPAPPAQSRLAGRVRALAEALGWPLLAEAGSQLRDGRSLERAAALLDTSFAKRQRPDLILQLGRAPAASAWGRRLADWCSGPSPSEHWVFSEGEWHDPENTASGLIFGDLGAGLDRLLEGLGPDATGAGEQTSAYLDGWSRASAIARRVGRDLLERESSLREPQAIGRLVSTLDPGVQLVLGNSLPVREVDLWVDAEAFAGRRVLHQRGLSGIDGQVAGTAGAAADGAPTLALLGDVSLRHDQGSLELLGRTPGLVLAVVDNGGGRIFEQLPLARHPVLSETDLAHWLQPAEIDLAALARAHGMDYSEITRASDLDSVIDRALGAECASLLHLRVEPSSAAEDARELVRRLQLELEREGLA